MEEILVFGHKSPDTDSICSSIIMANLQSKVRKENVIACRLGELNEETKYALNYFKVEEPKLIEKVEEGQKVILVDHNEFAQSVEGIENAKIDTVVDHHRINDFKTSEPLFYFAQPVGCTATLLFELYTLTTEIRPDRKESISMKNLIAFARKRGGKSMADKLAAEILDAYNEQGGAFKRKEDMHRMAEANRAFAHFRF